MMHNTAWQRKPKLLDTYILNTNRPFWQLALTTLTVVTFTFYFIL